MANLWSDTIILEGFKSLEEITGLTFTSGIKYYIQTISSNNSVYVREGSEGKGFLNPGIEPFEWKYDGENSLYIGCGYIKGGYEKPVYINVSQQQ